jgi:hypothetical protein
VAVVLQKKMMILLMVAPMLRMQSCRVEVSVKAAVVLCSVPPERVLHPKMMSPPTVMPMALQPEMMMSLMIVSRVAVLQPNMSMLVVLRMLRTQSCVEVGAASAGCAPAARGVLEAVRHRTALRVHGGL